MIVDHWVWPEYSDGSPQLYGLTVTEETTQEDKECYVARVFANQADIVRCREWQQHDTYQGLEGPVNVLVETWERHTFYFVESIRAALEQKLEVALKEH